MNRRIRIVGVKRTVIHYRYTWILEDSGSLSSSPKYIILKFYAFIKKKKKKKGRNVNKQESMWQMGEWKRQKSLLDAQMSDLIDFTTSIIVCSKN